MRLLIIGSLDGYMTAAGKIAVQRGAKVSHVDTIEAGINALRNGQGGDLLMVDLKLDIAKLLQQLQSERINVPVVACGIGSDAGAAVRAIKAGAKEYLPLPPDAELIGAVLSAVTEESHTLIWQSPAMQKTLALAEQVAGSDATILITGESGTGKEVLSRFIHRKSKRANNIFVSVNCAAIPENLLESELFGHEKGAFTGAVARRIGKFEEANGGTLLLDEVTEMPLALQSKLLRAIQEREIDRIGGNKPVKVDIRLIATSNRDLRQAVAEKIFREDLYYRLNVINLALPPLRERVEDIAVLADYFIKKYSEANGVSARALSPDALKKMQSHSWRGNVRELENAMHRAVLLATGSSIGSDAILLQQDEPSHSVKVTTEPAAADKPNGGMIGRTVADVERELIINTLNHCLGNRTHAANILGISIRTLRNKLKLYTEDGVAIPDSDVDPRVSA